MSPFFSCLIFNNEISCGLALRSQRRDCLIWHYYDDKNCNSNNDGCRDAGYDDGQNGPFSQPTYDHCGDEEDGNLAYYNGFIDGCMSVEGNRRDICESATDS